MKITKTIKKEFEVSMIQVDAGVRYWEDATVNGVEDTEGDLIPAREGDRWTPGIEVATGKVVNWPKGTTANIHYKVCDDGIYQLFDKEGNMIHEQNSYVPKTLAPNGESFGDYIIMKIDENGVIANWNPKGEDFDGGFGEDNED